jgi:methionine biosynthesis protein MetW
MNPGIYRRVLDWIPERARVLDLGAGDGAFLQQLVEQRHVNAEGVEKNPELVARSIQRGLVAHQGDIAEGLDQYGDQTFDYVLLLGTFQELVTPANVIRDAFRVGRYVIVAYSNFAHYWVRLQVLFGGRTPVTKSLPQPWYRTTNLHFLSILDFREFCQEVGVAERRSAHFNAHGPVRILPNIFAEEVVAMLEKAVAPTAA